jgi:hypothetical protein
MRVTCPPMRAHSLQILITRTQHRLDQAAAARCSAIVSKVSP